MDGRKIYGLRVFLLTLLEMISKGIYESCDSIELKMSDGVAAYLYKKYGQNFNDNGFSYDEVNKVDEYYKQLCGCADRNEIKHYLCAEANGLSLLIALALNEIY